MQPSSVAPFLTGMQSEPRRAELAAFLRMKRAEIAPEVVAFSRGTRRRTPGLRREEVAERAGISSSLYTWLEQGRNVPVSSNALDAVAGALNLSADERMHVRRLLEKAPASVEAADAEVPPSLERMVRALTNPAFVLDLQWNIVLRNAACEIVFDHEGEWPQNLLENVFLSPGLMDVVENWDEVARMLLEMFRLDYDLYMHVPGAQALVARLLDESERFAGWWEQRGVRSHPQGNCIVNVSEGRKLTLEATLYGVIESPAYRIMAFTPADAQTASTLRDVLATDDRSAQAS